MLTAEQEDLWNEYLLAESHFLREKAISTLNLFIAELLESANLREQWSFFLSQRVVDENKATPIRMPLFRKVIFPSLLDGLHHRKPGCARWLAGFSQHLYQCPDLISELAEDEQTEIGLLFSAIKHDPSDDVAGGRLVSEIANRLAYTLHELPAGVLYGLDGATSEQCLELQNELAQFTILAKRYSSLSDYQQLIENCRIHYYAYPNYLSRKDEFSSYNDYLEERQKP